MATGNKIFQWQGDTSQPFEDWFTWKSGRYLYPVRKTFAAARVIAETGDRETYYQTLALRQEIIRRNNERISLLVAGGALAENVFGAGIYEVGGDLLEDVPALTEYAGDFDLMVKFYVDGTLKFTKNVYASNVPFRLNSGYRGRDFEIEIVGNVQVRRFDMAGSMAELKQLMNQEG